MSPEPGEEMPIVEEHVKLLDPGGGPQEPDPEFFGVDDTESQETVD